MKRLIGRIWAGIRKGGGKTLRAMDMVRVWAGRLAVVIAVLMLARTWFLLHPSIEEGSLLLVMPEGRLALQPRTPEINEMAPADEINVRKLVAVIRQARDDDKITGMLLRTDRLAPSGIVAIDTLRKAVRSFAEKKPVYAYGEGMDQGQYFLATAATDITVHPLSSVEIHGLAAYLDFFGGLMDKVGVDVMPIKAGRYKGAVEPYTRSAMSAPVKKNYADLLNNLWDWMRGEICRSRNIVEKAFDEYVSGNSNSAEQALRTGLIDHVEALDALERRMIKAGVARWNKDRSGIRVVSAFRYGLSRSASLDRMPKHVTWPLKKVQVIVLRGDIVHGDAPRGTIGSLPAIRLLREARSAPEVKAVVLWIDSPGGEVVASDRIRDEVVEIRKAGKPVVVCMAGATASGGYWIASAADVIVAHPATITGSIGVFALYPSANGLLKKVGINIDGVATGDLAGAGRIEMPLNQAYASRMQREINRIYDQFLERVVKGRKIDRKRLMELAEGRVWSGRQAIKVGLADELGDIDMAIRRSERLAGLDDRQVVVEFVEKPLTVQEKLAQSFAEKFRGADLGAIRFLVSRISHAVIMNRPGLFAREPVNVLY